MALVNYTHRWLYLMEPHTASRAVALALAEHQGGSKVGHHHIGCEELTFWRRQHIRRPEFQTLRRICTVRNPLDTLITKWKIHPKKDMTLRDWFHEHKENLKINFGLYKEAHIWCWYEDLEADLQWVFSNKDLKLGYNPAHKTVKKIDWWTYYTEELMHEVIEHCAPYIRRFGYQYEYGFNGAINLTIDKDIRARLCVPLVDFRIPR